MPVRRFPAGVAVASRMTGSADTLLEKGNTTPSRSATRPESARPLSVAMRTAGSRSTTVIITLFGRRRSILRSAMFGMRPSSFLRRSANGMVARFAPLVSPK